MYARGGEGGERKHQKRENDFEPSGEIPCGRRDQAGRLQRRAHRAGADASAVYGLSASGFIKTTHRRVIEDGTEYLNI